MICPICSIDDKWGCDCIPEEFQENNMSQKEARKIRKAIKSNHQVWVTARWRFPFSLLPGLKKGYFEITLFPKLQWLFHFRMVHAIEMPATPPLVDKEPSNGVLRRIWEAASDYKLGLCNDEFANQFGGVDALKKILFDLIDAYEVGSPAKDNDNHMRKDCPVKNGPCDFYAYSTNKDIEVSLCMHPLNPNDTCYGPCTTEFCPLSTKNPIKGDESCPKCNDSGHLIRYDVISTTKSVDGGVASEIEYKDKDGVVVGYWAYGSFDPQYGDPFRCDCAKGKS